MINRWKQEGDLSVPFLTSYSSGVDHLAGHAAIDHELLAGDESRLARQQPGVRGRWRHDPQDDLHLSCQMLRRGPKEIGRAHV